MCGVCNGEMEECELVGWRCEMGKEECGWGGVSVVCVMGRWSEWGGGVSVGCEMEREECGWGGGVSVVCVMGRWRSALLEKEQCYCSGVQ